MSLCTVCSTELDAHGKGHAPGCKYHPDYVAPISSALEVFEQKMKGVPLEQMNLEHLLLLDIARSLREQTRIAQEGMDFSKALAEKF